MTYNVELVPKEGYKLAHRIKGDYVFSVKDRLAPTFHVYIGCTYVFYFTPPDDLELPEPYTFFFTIDPIGGPMGQEPTDDPDYSPPVLPGTSDPIMTGNITLTITDETPRQFYYQSTTDTCMGGLIVVHRAR
jgi:hypothetical protein